eukprot:scaffold300_cov173-Ochromonas_danica.AAC.18
MKNNNNNNNNSDDEVFDYSEEDHPNQVVDQMSSSIKKIKSNLLQAGYRDRLSQEEERIRQDYFDKGLLQGILCGELAGQLYGLIRKVVNSGLVEESEGDCVGKLLLSILSSSAAASSTCPSHCQHEEEGEEGSCSSSNEKSHSSSDHTRVLLDEASRLLQSFPHDVQQSYETFRSQIEQLLSCK